MQKCKYYHCHFEGQDCTFCYCPFYPCRDETKGRFVIGRRSGKKVWSCKNCGWIHEEKIARAVSEELKSLRQRLLGGGDG